MGLHILVIDADPHAARITGAVLNQLAWNAEISVAASPAQASEHMLSHWVDIVCIDPSPSLPSAIRLIKHVMGRTPRVPVVVLASMPTPSLRRQMRELKVDCYFEKPLLLPLCIGDLRDVLERAGGAQSYPAEHAA